MNWTLRAATLLAGALLAAGCEGHDSSSGEHAHNAAAPALSAERFVARSASDPHAAHRDRSTPPGYAAFTVNPAQTAGLGLATEPVAERAFKRLLRTTGVVTLDETRTSHVHSKVRGWIESVSADFVGKQVRAGTPLCTLYSQEVYAAQVEFLSILGQPGPGTLAGPFSDAERAAREQVIAAARRRLGLWDVPAAEIERLERTREPRRTFTLTAPRSGIVVAKQALAGMFIDPSVELYVISDTSRLWVQSDVYGGDLPWVKVGDHAVIVIEGMGAEPVHAKVSFLPPTIEESTRTLKVRFDLDNESRQIRPGAFATVEMNLDLGRALAVPESAVIHAGENEIVFVVAGNRVEPRSVELGPLAEGYYRVDRGLSAGDAVAVGAQFLIDSESRLRATSAPGAAHGGH